LENQHIAVTFDTTRSSYIYKVDPDEVLTSETISESLGIILHREDVAHEEGKNNSCEVNMLNFEQLGIDEKSALDLAMNSRKLIQEHNPRESNVANTVQKRVIFQSQEVRSVPVCVVEYEYKDRRKILVTRGNDHRAKFCRPDGDETSQETSRE